MSGLKAGGDAAGGSGRSSAGGDAASRKAPPLQKKVAECCLELLHIEIVALYVRMQQQQQQQPAQARNELMVRRMEAIGFQVGQQLAERYTLDRPRFVDHLEVVKFLCRDIWTEVFKKQIDNLKTNHKGVFVLQDNKFRWLLHLSADAGHHLVGTPLGHHSVNTPSTSIPSLPASSSATPSPPPPFKGAVKGPSLVGIPNSSSPPPLIQSSPVEAAAMAAASQYLLLPCGIIKGVLTNLGVPCSVSAEVTTLPACAFTIRIKS